MNKTRNGMSWKEASALAGKWQNEQKRKRIVEYNLNPTKCSNCNKSFEYEKRKCKFCSHSCSATYNNLGKLKSGCYALKPCIGCGKLTKNRKYCSNKCFSKYYRIERAKQIAIDGFLTNKHEKWYLEETRGHRCEFCGLTEWLNEPIPLDFHHRDGDSDNNHLDNVQLICPNCHRSTKNHGSKNRGNGRYSKRKVYRNKRYELGLSY